MLRLILLSTGGTVQVTERLIDKDLFILGKEEGLDWTLPDRLVSRKHLTLEKRENEWWLKDMNSTNGTYVNGEVFTEKTITHHDVIQIGETSFLVNLSADPVPMHETIAITSKIPFIQISQEHLAPPKSNPLPPQNPIDPPKSSPPARHAPQRMVRKIPRTVQKSSLEAYHKQNAKPSKPSHPALKTVVHPLAGSQNNFSEICFICGCVGLIGFLPAIILGHLDKPNTLQRQKQREIGLSLGYLFLFIWMTVGVYFWSKSDKVTSPVTRPPDSTAGDPQIKSTEPRVSSEKTEAKFSGFKKNITFPTMRNEKTLSLFRLIWMPDESLRKSFQEGKYSSGQSKPEGDSLKALQELPQTMLQGVVLSEVRILRAQKRDSTAGLRLITEDCVSFPTFWKFNTSVTEAKKTIQGSFIFPENDPFFFFDRDPNIDMKVEFPNPSEVPWYKAYRGVEWGQGDLTMIQKEIALLRMVLFIQPSNQSAMIPIRTVEGKPSQLHEVIYPFQVFPAQWMAAALYQVSDQKLVAVQVNPKYPQAMIEKDIRDYFKKIMAAKPQIDRDATPSFVLSQ